MGAAGGLLLTGAQSASAATPGPGAGLAEPDGSLYTFAGSYPAIAGLARPVVGWAPHPGGGAWEVAADGGVFTRGGAPFFGSTGDVHLNEPIVGMAPTPDGGGYWLVGADGGVFSFGDAGFYGSTGDVHLNQPIVGMAPTPDGRGYWLVAADGGVFTFGDAGFYGSTGDVHLAQPVVGMAPTSDGRGYWLVGADGGVFTFGDAGFAGSASGRAVAPTVSMAPSPSGYDVVLTNGNVWSFAGGTASESQLPVPVGEVSSSQQVQAATAREAQEAATAVQVALSEVGKPYVYGASGPNAFDCSGLVQYSYSAAGISLPRTAAEQMASTAPVPAADLQPGDLLFFYPGITHVGIYVGNGEMVDAPDPGSTVRVEPYAYFGPVMGVTNPTIGH